MRFDTKLEYETLSGHPCQYIAELPTHQTHTHLFCINGADRVYYVDDDGRVYGFGKSFSIREKKKKIVQLANVYRDSSGWMHMGTLYDSKFDCDFYGDLKSRIACVKIEFEEGEGL